MNEKLKFSFAWGSWFLIGLLSIFLSFTHFIVYVVGTFYYIMMVQDATNDQTR